VVIPKTLNRSAEKADAAPPTVLAPPSAPSPPKEVALAKSTVVSPAPSLPSVTGAGTHYQRPKRRVVASVNGRTITAERLEYALSLALEAQRRVLGAALNRPDEHRAFLGRVSKIREKVLQDLIDDEVVLSAAEQEGIVIAEEELWRAVEQLQHQYRSFTPSSETVSQVKNDLIRQRFQAQHAVAPPPTPGEVRAYYRAHAHLPRNQSLPKVSLRALVLYRDRSARTKRESAETLMEFAHSAVLEEGDFVASVKRYSEGPFRDRGGLQSNGEEPYCVISTLAQPIQKALQHAEPRVGMVIGPIALEHCLALIRVEGFQEKAPRPLRELYSGIETRLLQQARKKTFQRYFNRIRDKADIRIFE
jgi:hypothetical protein